MICSTTGKYIILGNTDSLETHNHEISLHCQLPCYVANPLLKDGFFHSVAAYLLQILCKPGLKPWPCQIDCLLMMLPKANCLISLNSFRRAVHEGMTHFWVYVHFWRDICFLQLLFQSLRSLNFKQKPYTPKQSGQKNLCDREISLI